MKNYDLVFLAGTPSFYKTNLFNRIGRYSKVLVIYCGFYNGAVNSDEKDLQNSKFEYKFLHKGDIAKRCRLLSFLKLILILNRISYKYIIHEGWYVAEYCLHAFISDRSKNCTLCESTILESDISGYKGYVKRLIINRSAIALPSGEAHKSIFLKLGYNGEIKITGGIGIIDKSEARETKLKACEPHYLRYLFVGRLESCKNLSFLIERFNKNGKSLTVVGCGSLEKELKMQAKENISFKGFVENRKLRNIYRQHDVLILPSISETWGIVIEEAIYFGLPVLVSNRVGCLTEMVERPKTGVVFEIENSESFDNAINEMENRYDTYRINAGKFDFDKKDKQQVDVFITL